MTGRKGVREGETEDVGIANVHLGNGFQEAEPLRRGKRAKRRQKKHKRRKLRNGGDWAQMGSILR